MKKTLCILAALGMVVLVILSGCGGGGGGGGNSGSGGTPTVSGTVASGGPLAGATVTLKDSAGNSRTATTAGNGTYSLDTTSLTPPFLLLVTTATQTFYSVSADANDTSTINITPFTDLIIRAWYGVQGVSVDAAFVDPGSNPPPSPTAVAVISTVVQNVVQLWLNDAGVTAGSFNLISTPFTADGTGIDQVLDQTTVDTSAGSVIISSGSVTQSSVVTAGTGSMNIVTITTGPTGTSTSSNTAVVPVQTAQQTALDGITTAVNNFANIVNTKGTSLTGSDLLPFLEPSGLYSGLTYTQWAQQAAYAFKGKTISFSGVTIKSLGATTADTIFQLSQSQGGQTSTSPQELFFTKLGSTWLLSGDQRIANVEVRASMVRNQGSSTGSQLTLEVNTDSPRSDPTVTSLTGVAISGGPWSAASLSYDGLNIAPWDSNLKFDSFGIYALNPSISGGAPFTVVVTPFSGLTVTYTQTLNAITTEPISITNLTGGSILTDAHLGSPLTVDWTLPKTFAISNIRIGTVAYSGPSNSFKCDDMGMQAVLGITTTTAQVTIPATCNSLPTAQAEIYLQVYGINGELTQVYYQFQ